MRRRYIGEMPVGQIMARWPATIHVFLDQDLLCVGCPIAMFHTIIDAAEEHGLDALMLEQALEASIKESEKEA